MAEHSRQYEWSQKRVSEGKCANCGAPRNLYTTRCDACELVARRGIRKRLGNRPWKKGKRGRPPKWAQKEAAACKSPSRVWLN